jgi:hypothetical protein
MKVVKKKGIDKIKISHNRGLFWLIIVLLIFFIWFLVYAAQNWEVVEDDISVNNQNDVVGDVRSGNECSSDSDCVPELCCHSATCVSVDKAMDCSNIMCTTECVPGTLDCRQSSCGCFNGYCGVAVKG